jgi:hypothetical protein
MRVAPFKSLTQATLILTLLLAGCPLAPRATHGASRIDLTNTSGGLNAGEKAVTSAQGGAAMSAQIPLPPIGGGGGSVSVENLYKSGPVFPASFILSKLKFTAFMRKGWPVVVDYELPQAGVVTLTIKADKDDKVDPFVKQLNGTTGRHEEIVHIPARFGDKSRVGIYTLVAVSDDRDAKPIELLLYGIGAGFKAVGSVGVNHITFQPNRVVTSAASGSAKYRFHSLFDFDNVSADFVLIRRVKGVSESKPVARQMIERGITRSAWHSGEWNCRIGKVVSKGKHQLHIRAWGGLKSEGDWVVGMSEQYVEVQ